MEEQQSQRHNHSSEDSHHMKEQLVEEDFPSDGYRKKMEKLEFKHLTEEHLRPTDILQQESLRSSADNPVGSAAA